MGPPNLDAQPTRGLDAGTRDDLLDGWRGVACLLVFFAHKALFLDRPPVVVPGSTGVVLFFVLTGYLLYRPFLAAIVEGRPPSSARRYLARRFLRIYPPYIASLAIFLAARSATGDKRPDAMNLITHLFLVFNYAGASRYYSINGVYWSLAIEAQFYLLLPMAAAAARRWGGGVWALPVGLALAGVGSRAAECLLIGPRSEAGVRYTSVFAHLDWFAAGMATAVAVRRGARSGIGWLAAGLALFLAGTNWARLARGADPGSAADLAMTIGSPTLVCAGAGALLVAVRVGPGPGWLGEGWLVRVGRISYSVYLYHIGVQVAVGRLCPLGSIRNPIANNAALALLSLPPTLALAAAMHGLVEVPCLRAMARLRDGRGIARGGPAD